MYRQTTTYVHVQVHVSILITELLECRVKKRIYQYCDNRSFRKLFLLNVDMNGTLQKLRAELKIKLHRKLSLCRFLFYSEDLIVITPKTECSYLVASVYESPTVVIKIINEQGKPCCHTLYLHLLLYNPLLYTPPRCIVSTIPGLFKDSYS